MKENKLSSHLSGGRLNVALVQEALRSEFLNLLRKCEGPKVTIWDEWLAGPFDLVAQYAILKEHEVIEMFPLKPGSLPAVNAKHFIFITRSKLDLMDLVAEYTKLLYSKNPSVEFHLFMVPRKSELSEQRLKNKGVLGRINLQPLKCDIFPIDSDVMSLELQNDFREYYLEGDPTCLYNAAQALKTLQNIYGVIPRVLGKGETAKKVWDVFCRLNREDQGPRLATSACIDQLLILDRNIDFISVLSTQLTYEGLIDEIFGIKATTATFPGHKFAGVEEPSPDIASHEKKRVVLNSAEELFQELRDKNFGSVGSTLSKKARIIKTQLEEQHRDKSVAEIKNFVSRLPQLLANKQSLATHTAIAEYIKEETDTFDFHDTIQCEEDFLNCVDIEKPCAYIEDLIAQKVPLVKVLRLICLQCVAGSGLKPKVLEYYKREIVQVYGIGAWLSLCNLDKCGVLKAQTAARQYILLRKALHITADDPDTDEGEKSYLTNKFTPITVRLVEHFAKNKNWTGINDFLGLLPGQMFDEVPLSQPSRRNSITSDNSTSLDTPRVILVYFVGGCTYNEISALRAISQMEELNVELVILTTKLINGNTFIDSLLEK